MGLFDRFSKPPAKHELVQIVLDNIPRERKPTTLISQESRR